MENSFEEHHVSLYHKTYEGALEKGLLIQEIIDDSSDKTPYTDAISAANTYLET